MITSMLKNMVDPGRQRTLPAGITIVSVMSEPGAWPVWKIINDTDRPFTLPEDQLALGPEDLRSVPARSACLYDGFKLIEVH